MTREACPAAGALPWADECPPQRPEPTIPPLTHRPPNPKTVAIRRTSTTPRAAAAPKSNALSWDRISTEIGPAGHVDHHVSSSASDVQKPQRQTHPPVVADSTHMEDLPPYSCGHQRDPVHARQRPESRDVSRWIEILRVHELGLPMPAV